MKRLAGVSSAGVLFAIGLGLSGMTDPNKVLGFLDVAGSWDPSLALVMGGAIAVHVGAAHGRSARESLSGRPPCVRPTRQSTRASWRARSSSDWAGACRGSVQARSL